jgi:ABC-type glycerol-3-phosphate transport system substrate-binding protein
MQRAPLHDKIGVAPTRGRYVDRELARLSEIYVHGPGINKYSKKKEAAFKFFAFLTTLRFGLY